MSTQEGSAGLPDWKRTLLAMENKEKEERERQRAEVEKSIEQIKEQTMTRKFSAKQTAKMLERHASQKSLRGTAMGVSEKDMKRMSEKRKSFSKAPVLTLLGEVPPAAEAPDEPVTARSKEHLEEPSEEIKAQLRKEREAELQKLRESNASRAKKLFLRKHEAAASALNSSSTDAKNSSEVPPEKNKTGGNARRNSEITENEGRD